MCWSVSHVDESDIWGVPSKASCPANMATLPPSFLCYNGQQRVPYTLVCDHRQDCTDASDESFCVFPPCGGDRSLQCGTNRQCYSPAERCDQQRQCVDGTDEDLCLELYMKLTNIPPPAIIDFHGTTPTGRFPDVHPDQPDMSLQCPETHFHCPGDGYCLPVFLRCNNVYDCPSKADEGACSSYTCPGFYRCRASSVCVHPENVCDNFMHCPQQDDELFCNTVCPKDCLCYGLAFTCARIFPAQEHPDLKYLDASGSNMTFEHLQHNQMLVHLGLADCDLRAVSNISLPNLHSLDLRDNSLDIESVAFLSHLPRLRVLSLAGNPVTTLVLSHNTTFLGFRWLQTLDISRIKIKEMDVETWAFSTDTQVLNLSNSGIERITENGFKSLTKLRSLDVRGCPLIVFPRGLFDGLDKLQNINADNYRLCCQALLPSNFNPENCHAPFDEISSCEALLRSDIYRAFLAILAVLALVGNLGSFVVRVAVIRKKKMQSFSVFVTHLSISDLLMGVYLAIIGVADRVYQGTYFLQEVTWKQSVTCKMAGVLSLVSNEVSAFLITLITLDRFLVLRFPFSNIHFHNRSAHLSCAVVWITGISLSVLPLLPITRHWEFYGLTGICIPLPITSKGFTGKDFAFAVMIVLNFVLFLLIAVGQASVFISVRKNSISASGLSDQQHGLNIARRLITVAVSDFLCWFPIGILGLLASQGVPLPGELNVAMTVLVLPLNSAINPFLYTLNVVLERRRKAKEEQYLKSIMGKLANE